MIKHDYVITIEKNGERFYEQRSDRLCQAIKKFMGYCLEHCYIKDKSLVGYLIRHEFITRAKLTAICLFWTNDDINKQELEDAKNGLRVKEE